MVSTGSSVYPEMLRNDSHVCDGLFLLRDFNLHINILFSRFFRVMPHFLSDDNTAFDPLLAFLACFVLGVFLNFIICYLHIKFI